MPHQSLFDEVRVQRCIDPQDAAAVAKNGVTVDMQGYDGVAFVLSVGTVTTTVDMKAQQGDQSGGGDAADITGAAITQLAAADDNKVAVLDVKPGTYTKRYVRVVVTPVGAANLVSVVAVAYRRAGAMPVTQHTDTKQVKEV